MATVSERNRARLALRLLEQQVEPSAGDYVLIWARIEAPEVCLLPTSGARGPH